MYMRSYVSKGIPSAKGFLGKSHRSSHWYRVAILNLRLPTMSWAHGQAHVAASLPFSSIHPAHTPYPTVMGGYTRSLQRKPVLVKGDHRSEVPITF